MKKPAPATQVTFMTPCQSVNEHVQAERGIRTLMEVLLNCSWLGLQTMYIHVRTYEFICMLLFERIERPRDCAICESLESGYS